jgi:hypothetical protein
MNDYYDVRLKQVCAVLIPTVPCLPLQRLCIYDKLNDNMTEKNWNKKL